MSAAADTVAGPAAGEYPIYFNDHTVDAKPETLVRGRVLAALVKGGEIFVPLRAMFERMGATVSVSAGDGTITATKSGMRVSVSVGKPEVIVNGESRPLDVPPLLDHGIVLVPVRVISEALGAYVQWVPSRRAVVVRYLAVAAPPPPPEPTPLPTIAATAPPFVPPVVVPAETYHAFVEGAITASHNYNEFADGQHCPESYLISAAFIPKHSRFALKADFRQDVYLSSANLRDALGNQYTQFATVDGGIARTPVFLARQNSFDVRAEYEIASPQIYVGVGYLETSDNFGYPHLDAAGFGLEKLPNFHSIVDVYGSAFYYPGASGNYTVSSAGSPDLGVTYRQQYNIAKYDIGLVLTPPHSPVFLYGGFNADRYYAHENAPIGQVHEGLYGGLGLRK